MRRLRLYLDSSIFGWSLNCGNPGRFTEANKLLQQIAKGKFIGAYSWVNEQEILRPQSTSQDALAENRGSKAEESTDAANEAGR